MEFKNTINYIPFILHLIFHMVNLTYHVSIENHIVKPTEISKISNLWGAQKKGNFFLSQIHIWDLSCKCC